MGRQAKGNVVSSRFNYPVYRMDSKLKNSPWVQQGVPNHNTEPSKSV